MEKTDEMFMKEALAEAEKAGRLGEVPVGAVAVADGRIVARAGNRRESDRMATAHAEMLCLEECCRTLGRWRLEDVTLYVTLEPCPMCAGAVFNARVGRVVYGAKDPSMGACGSVLDLRAYPLHTNTEFTSGVCARQSGELLRDFFARRRRENEQQRPD